MAVKKHESTVRAFLGRVVEEKFHTTYSTWKGCERRILFRKLIKKSRFSNGPEFYENTATGEELDKNEDEPYILPENLFDIRRLSDSSLDRNLEEHDQYGGALTEEMLRCAREDLNQMDDQKRRTDRDDNLSNLLIDPSHSDGMYLKILHVLKAVCPTKQ
ncbi:hypothetical protein G6F57_002111 [Rhizopus arrhizus]|uniref:Uncharacterized protein n=1 Tax=Rhizopus oryzae TaxID=64495 RepID=A0A9P6XFV4_RHIOR|nr:hypothetical protein G6F23_004632 [Rhizopus arrhizus]KAG1425208.1 hypothetical protein G6F58_002041 [Rhizopus delemar]KAG0767933.1 hypothetical protein G6F24_002376 [Rhizopus arrhizus]KAG0784330.1 hypothetical protein G6F22_008352 [Rhizopus arrhizus]KAG0795190.1 hypothetical protein G6F21_002301 [Rhizopus arrhizus]